MPKIDIGIVGQSNKSRIRQIDSQECVNWYPEGEDARSKAAIVLMPTPGLTLYRTISEPGPVRGMYVTADETMYVVVGSTFIEMTAKTYISRGNLLSGSGPVNMSDNGAHNQMIIVDGEYGYVYNRSDHTLTQITAFPGGTGSGSSHVLFFDGYFFVNEIDSGRFYFSNLYNGAVWSASDYYTAEGSPDNLLAISKTAQEIWLFGTRSTEMWFNFGTGFARINNAFIEIGTAAKYSVTTSNAHMFWLGSNVAGTHNVMHALGFNPERISTHAIEYQIGQMPRVDDAIGFCYQQEGHLFYVLTFPTGNQTWVYDLTTGAWHQRTWYNEANESIHRHRASCQALWNAENYVGDRANGNIYKWDLGAYTDNGGKIQRVRTCPHVSAKSLRVSYNQFDLDLEKGVGTVVYDVIDADTVASHNFSADSTAADWTGNSDWSLTDGTSGAKFLIESIDSTNALSYYGRDESRTSTTASLAWLYPDSTVASRSIRIDTELFITDTTDATSSSFWMDVRKTDATNSNYYEMRIDSTRVNSDMTTTLFLERYTTVSGSYQHHTLISRQLDPDYTAWHDVALSIDGTGIPMSLACIFDGTESRYQDRSQPISDQGNVRVGFDGRTTQEARLLSITHLDATTYYTTDYREPQAMLRWSDDGGMTWGPERWQGFGKIGEYYKTCKWRRLGQGDNRVFRLTIADPIRSAIIASHVDIEPEMI